MALKNDPLTTYRSIIPNLPKKKNPTSRRGVRGILERMRSNDPLPRYRSFDPNLPKKKMPTTRRGVLGFLERMRRKGMLHQSDIPLLREMRFEFGTSTTR